MPRYTVSVEMEIIADDEVHAAALGYRAFRDNPPPLYYIVTDSKGDAKNIVVDREAADLFTETQDSVVVIDSLLGLFKSKRS